MNVTVSRLVWAQYLQLFIHHCGNLSSHRLQFVLNGSDTSSLGPSTPQVVQVGEQLEGRERREIIGKVFFYLYECLNHQMHMTWKQLFSVSQTRRENVSVMSSYCLRVPGIFHEVLCHLHVLLDRAGLCKPQRVQVVLHLHTHHVHHLQHREVRGQSAAK